jgi:hypothetical protein
MNRLIIYLSGFTGFLLLALYILGLFADRSYDIPVLITALVLILFICLPMIFIERYRQNRKLEEIMRKHKKPEQDEIVHSNQTGKKVKRWSMNNSPFRDRRSGATWGGGNIHGSIPKRGGRKGLFRL